MSQSHPFNSFNSFSATGVFNPTDGNRAASQSASEREQMNDLALAPALDVAAALRARPLRVLMVAAEAVPYLKTGGPADVTGPLAHALRRLGHDVRLALPRYKSVDPVRWNLRSAVTDLAVPLSDGLAHLDILETQHEDGLRVVFVDAPHAFQRAQLYGYADDGERFILFCRAALEYARAVGWAPDVIHCHDWHTAIIPNWTKTIYRCDPFFANTATVYTIHNLAHHGMFGYRILEIAGVAQEGFLYPELPELANVVDLMGRGILFADAISTVSPRYAHEVLTPQLGEQLDKLLRERADRLYGILNGIDTDAFDPATDRSLSQPYDAFSLDARAYNKRALQRRLKLPPTDGVPLLAMISRLQAQKGFDLLEEALAPVLSEGVQLVVMGTGDQRYHQFLLRLAAQYPHQVAVQFTFSDELSRAIYAGADLLLMPSRFEPCGLTQMLAMRYGCIPIVHRVGGLADTVQDFDDACGEADAAGAAGKAGATGTGFSFADYTAGLLLTTIRRALAVYRQPHAWRDLMQRAMLTDYSWDASAEHYVALYHRAQELQRQDHDTTCRRSEKSVSAE